MRLSIKTSVRQSWPSVTEGFTRDLFLALNPPFPPVRLLRFDGCKKGDVVSLELNFIFFKQQWTSLITDDQTGEDYFQFIDIGEKLPFFLSKWTHTHRIQETDDGSVIIDDIHYSTGTLLTDLLFWPVLLGQFAYRKPIYKRWFS